MVSYVKSLAIVIRIEWVVFPRNAGVIWRHTRYSSSKFLPQMRIGIQIDACYQENSNQKNERRFAGRLSEVVPMSFYIGWPLSGQRLDAVLRYTIGSSGIRFWGRPKYSIDQESSLNP